MFVAYSRGVKLLAYYVWDWAFRVTEADVERLVDAWHYPDPLDSNCLPSDQLGTR
jgi:hypothetical protein